MTLTIDISPEVYARLEAEAAEKGLSPSEHLREVVEARFTSTRATGEVVPTDWDALTALLERCQVDTGITDLAHQHDHYIHGTPKRKD